MTNKTMPEKISKKQLLELLSILSNSDDPEDAHQDADELLLRFIDDDEIRDAFKSITRWYA
jgi:hypothetical protein